MRPGTRAWGKAVWLLLALNAPIILAGLLVDNTPVEVIGLTVAVIAVAAAYLHLRSRKETS